MHFSENHHEMEQLKTQLKKKITEFIEQNAMENATSLIKQYEALVSADPDICTFKGIIPFIKGDYITAERWFKEGLALDNNHFDLLYNLGFINDQQGKQNEAYRYYQRAHANCSQIDLKTEIERALLRLKEQGATETAPSLKKKVLIIAHRFPPVAGSGVQRTLKFVKYIRECGWEPVVVTVGKTRYPLNDVSLLKDIPDDITIIRVDERDVPADKASIQELMEMYSSIINKREVMSDFTKAINQHEISLIQPDLYILWGLDAVKALKEKVDFNEIDLLYSTSGPYTDHIIGYLLKQTYQKPWIADFRDEWTNNAYSDYDKKSILHRVHYSMEERMVKEADHLITTTPAASQSYREIFQLSESKLTTITNGFDEQDFLDIQPSAKKNEKFTLIHNGILYSIRTPLTFMQAISNLIAKGSIDKNRLHIGLTWTEDEEKWKEAAKRLKLQNVVHFYGYLSHRDSLLKANASDALVLILGPGEKNKAIYPGKVFEYLRLNKPIIALSPEGSLVEQLLTDTDRGINVDFEDIESIELAVLQLYNDWKNQRQTIMEPDEKIMSYERRNQTQALSGIFDQVLENYNQQQSKTKLCFFSIKDGDKFLNDTVDQMSQYYNVKKIIVTDLNQINEGMKWADICWFEWCDHLIEYGSKLPHAVEKKIICRLHSYEAFSEHPNNVYWQNVDELILVSNSVAPILDSRFPNLKHRVKTTIIPNGVNLEKYKLRAREKGFNIAFVGYMIPHKNPMMLLQFAQKLIQKNPLYKIHVAGEFRDEKLKLYWDHQLRELSLERHVFFEGYQVDMNHFLADKNYLISTTMYESFGYGIAEAMACGIKPVIHNYPYSKETWPEKYLFNTIEDAIDHIMSDEYDSHEYRTVIESKYSMDRQMRETLNVLREVENNTKDKREFVHSFDYIGRRVLFYLPNLEDYIQRTIFQTSSFYEHTMLDHMEKRGIANKVVVDIGANIGNHTVFFAKVAKAKAVYSFEPYTEVFNILKRNVEINELSHIVTLHNFALGARSGRGTLNVRNTTNLGMTMVEQDGHGNTEIHSLDSLLLHKADQVDVIKIDVEGMGIDVLEGALGIVKKFSPLIYIEAETQQELVAINQILAPLGYRPTNKYNATPTYLFEK